METIHRGEEQTRSKAKEFERIIKENEAIPANASIYSEEYLKQLQQRASELTSRPNDKGYQGL